MLKKHGIPSLGGKLI